MKPLIFLSHTKEERLIALLLEEAIMNEFKVVDVFCSSDEKSIYAGEEIMTNIDNALVNCVSAIFLVSPVSFKSKWINFELGAIRMRNLKRSKTSPIIRPIPVCIGGIKPSELEMPLNTISAMIAIDPNQLRAVFHSIQNTLEVTGVLTTNFERLAKDIENLEEQGLLTDASEYVEMLHHINIPVKDLEKSIKFYSQILKLKRIKRAKFDFKGAWFGLPSGQHLHLVLKPNVSVPEYVLPIIDDTKTPPDAHFALRVSRSSLDAIELSLLANRYDHVRQPFPLIGIFQLYALDPDGYMVEFTAIEVAKRTLEYIEE
jgi:catechol 2,3-dioxygenase-like lactoylglutathione lyase family enzyme